MGGTWDDPQMLSRYLPSQADERVWLPLPVCTPAQPVLAGREEAAAQTAARLIPSPHAKRTLNVMSEV